VGPRYEELFHLVRSELCRSGFEEFLAAGVVLTGGASNVSGSVELAEKIFELPVRLGHPQYIRGNSEVTTNGMYATSTGLLLYGYQQQCEQRKPNHALFGGKIARIKNWLCENF
jgi:cell division protein FtsA